MSDPHTVHPRVTLLLLTYNQVNYIEQAILSALRQDYHPLEIIISDDCSSDGTLERAGQILATIDTAHHVLVNKTPTNLGPIQHLRYLTEHSRGDIFVLAAGDDISRHDRVRSVISAFEDDVYAVFSAVNIIDEQSKILRQRRPWRAYRPISLSDLCVAGGIGPGASYSYRREVFSFPFTYNGESVSEDRVFPFRAGLLGKVVYLDEPLVDWRIHENNLSTHAVKQWENPKITVEHYSVMLLHLVAAARLGIIDTVNFETASKIVLKNFSTRLDKNKLLPSLIKKVKHLARTFFDAFGYKW